jgi:hypothetical protein
VVALLQTAHVAHSRSSRSTDIVAESDDERAAGHALDQHTRLAVRCSPMAIRRALGVRLDAFAMD